MTKTRGIIAACCVATLGAALAGCGNDVTTRGDGATALARAADGTISVVVQTCASTVDDISFSLGRTEGMDPAATNESVGRLKASSPQSGTIELPIERPTAPWTAEQPVRPPSDPDRLLLVIAGNRATNTEALQTTATMKKVAELKPDQLLFGFDGEVFARSAFRDKACRPSS